MRLRDSSKSKEIIYSVYHLPENKNIHYNYDELYYMRVRVRFEIGKERYSVYYIDNSRFIHYTYDELYYIRLRVNNNNK